MLNGLLDLLLSQDDPVAVILRKLYVFKIIPILNPDGVIRGHYRTDTRGVNLNRMYLNPIFSLHPTIYAARALILYYHYGFEKEELKKDDEVCSRRKISEKNNNVLNKETKEKHTASEECKVVSYCFKISIVKFLILNLILDSCVECSVQNKESNAEEKNTNGQESGLFLYIDMHGHASKKGIFMYGNHFQDIEKSVECMLLPRIMTINNHNFNFGACNFSERNMYIR